MLVFVLLFSSVFVAILTAGILFEYEETSSLHTSKIFLALCLLLIYTVLVTSGFCLIGYENGVQEGKSKAEVRCTHKISEF